MGGRVRKRESHTWFICLCARQQSKADVSCPGELKTFSLLLLTAILFVIILLAFFPSTSQGGNGRERFETFPLSNAISKKVENDA